MESKNLKNDAWKNLQPLQLKFTYSMKVNGTASARSRVRTRSRVATRSRAVQALRELR